ncbi:SDR family NAD(P)-dependent oxidoreductase [Nocardia seriolae]|uniref:SDR family oxidoreductase n=1 Tax=Nocardia seriolae TaxID=37332 RepID=UPI0013220584|nr:SDR family oxidoreductase [Nocardia seriolae]MTL14597.1 SDR family NAD(P)-dependent oxidoreductase [Nocardia seriolae]
MSVSGRVVAITGGARGIGRATAEAFARAGAKVAIGDLDAELAKIAADEVEAASRHPVVGLPLDVTGAESFSAFLDSAEAALGDLDILVNNAGIMTTGEYLAAPPALTDRQIDINIRGVTTGSRLAAHRFTARGHGHIVNVASLAGVTGEPGLATYCGTKHFVIGFTEALWRELHPKGIGVTTVLPGFINTELSAGTEVPRWARRISVREPEDVATAIVTAVESDARTITVPKSLGLLLASTRMLPFKLRVKTSEALGWGAVFTDPDPAQRDRYHRRIRDRF